MVNDRSHDRQTRARAVALIGQQPTGDESGVADWLNRLCRAVAEEVRARAATITAGSPGETSAVVAADTPASRMFAEAEYAVGEGPAHDAWRFQRPVLVPELGGPYDGAWPGYTATATADGLLAVFAFPLQVGGVRVGVLTIHHDQVGPLAPADLLTCLVMAELATESLINSTDAAGGAFDPSLKDAVAFRSEIYQAQGMVAVALGVTLGDGLATMRGHAFQTGRQLIDVAYDVVHNGYRLADEQRDHHQRPERDEE